MKTVKFIQTDSVRQCCVANNIKIIGKLKRARCWKGYVHKWEDEAGTRYFINKRTNEMTVVKRDETCGWD